MVDRIAACENHSRVIDDLNLLLPELLAWNWIKLDEWMELQFQPESSSKFEVG
jgi:hypothetical protein